MAYLSIITIRRNGEYHRNEATLESNEILKGAKFIIIKPYINTAFCITDLFANYKTGSAVVTATDEVMIPLMISGA